MRMEGREYLEAIKKFEGYAFLFTNCRAENDNVIFIWHSCFQRNLEPEWRNIACEMRVLLTTIVTSIVLHYLAEQGSRRHT